LKFTNSHIRILFLVFIAGAFLYSCKSKQNVVATSKKKSSGELSEKERLSFDYLFLNANKEKMLGNYDLAAGLYAQCIKINPKEAAPYYDLATIYTYQNKLSQAAEFARQAYLINKENIWYSLLYAELLAQTGQFQKSIDVFSDIVKRNPTRVEVLMELGNIQEQMQQYDNAIKTYNQAEQVTGISEETSLSKQRVYLKQNKLNKAIEETKKLADAIPQEPRYRLMLAELYDNNKEPEKAYAIYTEALKTDPENPYILLSLADYHHKRKEYAKAFGFLRTAYANPDMDIDNKIKILLSFYMSSDGNEELNKEVYSLFEILIAAHPTDGKAYSVYGDFLYRDQKLAEAREQFKKALEYSNDKFAIWNQVIILDSELQDWEAMEKNSEKALEIFPTQPSFYLFSGLAKIQLKKYKEAVEKLELGAALVVDNPQLSSQFFSNLGDAYHRMNKHKESDSSYEKALKFDPNNVYVLNNYSYYLSIRKEKLEEAARMSKRANEIEPGSPSFQDTYAWILFQQGKYDEALVWITKAFENGGASNGVILEHKGDILFKTGNTREAIEYWKMAQEMGETSDKLQQKIKTQKYIE
jgi:tetratricopeptide (TPR) repeat protein